MVNSKVWIISQLPLPYPWIMIFSYSLDCRISEEGLVVVGFTLFLTLFLLWLIFEIDTFVFSKERGCRRPTGLFLGGDLADGSAEVGTGVLAAFGLPGHLSETRVAVLSREPCEWVRTTKVTDKIAEHMQQNLPETGLGGEVQRSQIPRRFLSLGNEAALMTFLNGPSDFPAVAAFQNTDRVSAESTSAEVKSARPPSCLPGLSVLCFGVCIFRVTSVGTLLPEETQDASEIKWMALQVKSHRSPSCLCRGAVRGSSCAGFIGIH